MSIRTISTTSDIPDIAMADKDETSKFFKRPPKKAVKPRKTPNAIAAQKEKKEESINMYKKKEEMTTLTEEKEQEFTNTGKKSIEGDAKRTRKRHR